MPPVDIRTLPPLGVEVQQVRALWRKRLALASNWFPVAGLELTSYRGTVALHRGGRIVASSTGEAGLFVGDKHHQAHRPSRWKAFSTLPIGDGRIVEMTHTRSGTVLAQLHVMPDDVRLEVLALGLGFTTAGRGCRINLVSGLIDTEVALRCLVYFWAKLEEEHLSTS